MKKYTKPEVSTIQISDELPILASSPYGKFDRNQGGLVNLDDELGEDEDWD